MPNGLKLLKSLLTPMAAKERWKVSGFLHLKETTILFFHKMHLPVRAIPSVGGIRKQTGRDGAAWMSQESIPQRTGSIITMMVVDIS